MNPQEDVSLAVHTTFHIGGPARFFIEAHTEKDIEEAILFSHTHHLPLYPLGAGSNVLVPDSGVDGVVLRIALDDIAFEKDGDDTLLIAGAGASWDAVVDAVGVHGLFGIENLAGIPGTLGGAAVQNIGAYGAELSSVFEYADIIDAVTDEHKRITRAEAAFAYRTSFFKKNRTSIITRVALRFAPGTAPNLSYADLAKKKDSGEPLATPVEIANVIRAIRAQKFPHGGEEGTAGSFFKNPVLTRESTNALGERFPELPVFPQADGTAKISLAWLLDHALSLKGYAIGHVRLYEKQPLVVVANAGATAQEVNAFANDIAERVFQLTEITLEREVESFGEISFS
jgi:UDP-N-acetylmuramate dehydrogenase